MLKEMPVNTDGKTTLKNVVRLFAPKLREASSIVLGIAIKDELALLTIIGSLIIVKA